MAIKFNHTLAGDIELSSDAAGTLRIDGNKVWTEGNDGATSGLDADTLDTLQAASFLRSDASDSFTSGTLTFNSGTVLESRGTVRIADSAGTDYAQFSHDGTDFNTAMTNTVTWNITGPDNIRFENDTDLVFETSVGADDGTRIYRAAGNALRIAYNANAMVIDAVADNNFEWRDSLDATKVAINHVDDRVDIRDGYLLRIFDSTDNDHATLSHDGTDFNAAFVGTTDWNITGITAIQAGTVDADFDALTATSYGGILEANLLDKSAAETVTGEWFFDGASLRVRNGYFMIDRRGDAAAAFMYIDGDVGTSKNILFRDNGVNDWIIQTTTSSNLSFGWYSGGVYQSAPMVFTKSDGTVDFNKLVKFNANLRVYDATATDYAQFAHDGTAFNLNHTTTSVFNIWDVSETKLRDGMALWIMDAGNTDYAAFSHDGTDFNAAFTNTGNFEITGANLYLNNQYAVIESDGTALIAKTKATTGVDGSIEIRGARNAPTAGIQMAQLLLNNYDVDVVTTLNGAKIAIEQPVGGDTNMANLDFVIETRQSTALVEALRITGGNTEIYGDLLLAGGNTTTGLTINSGTAGDAFVKLISDTDNAGSETDNPYVAFSQDGDAITALIGLTDTTDPELGGAISGLTTNSLLIHHRSATPIAMAINYTVRANLTQTGLDVNGALTATSYGGITEANLLDKTADETITGGYTFDTDTGVKPVVISRLGGANEALSIYVDDSTVYFNYTQDEPANAHYFDFRHTGTTSSLQNFRWWANGVEVLTLDKGGNLTADGDVSGVTIGGITEANLLDKSATETVSGTWTFSASTVQFGTGNNYLRASSSAGYAIRPNVSAGSWARGVIVEKQSDGLRLGGYGFLGNAETLTHFSVGFAADWWSDDVFRIDSNSVDVKKGYLLTVYNSANTDYAYFQHDGTDFNTTLVNTTDWNISGADIDMSSQAIRIQAPDNPNIDTYKLGYTWAARITNLDLGAHPEDYMFVFNAGEATKASDSIGLQIAASYGGSNYGMYIRRGSDNVGSENGAAVWQKWKRFVLCEPTTGDVILNGSQVAFRDNDEWLRLNPNGDFTSGIYCGSSTVRTDGEFQVGVSGATFRVSGGTFTYNGNNVYYVGNEPTVNFNDLANKDAANGDYLTTGDLGSGENSGGVALTINDGYGNANVTFNHRNGTPDNTSATQSAGRIECSTDNNTASFSFELGNSTVQDTPVALTQIMAMTTSAITSAVNHDFSAGIDVTGNITVTGTVDGRDIAADGSTLDAVASTYLLNTTDTFTGTLTLTGDMVFDGIPINESSHRPGLLEFARDGANAWAGISTSYSATAIWNFMSNETQCGIYNDINNQWALLATEAAEVTLYYNGSAKFATTNTGASVTGTLTSSTAVNSPSFGSTTTSVSLGAASTTITGGTALNLVFNSVTNLSLQAYNGTGNTTGAQVRKHDNVLYDVGLNVLPIATEDVSDTLEAIHCGGVYFKDGTTGVTLTLEASTSTDFPVGGVCTIINANTTGNITVNEGTGTTLYYLDGSTRTDTAGGCTVGPGGLATLWREDATIYYIWGSGITP